MAKVKQIAHTGTSGIAIIVHAPKRRYEMKGKDQAMSTQRRRPAELTTAIKLEILEVKSNEIRTVVLKDHVFNVSDWEDGNFSCDCSRHLLFTRAAGGEPDHDAPRPCGDAVRYKVNVYAFGAGAVLYREFNPPAGVTGAPVLTTERTKP